VRNDLIIYRIQGVMSQDWTEKYRPDSLSKVLGNPKAVSDLTAWAKSWNKGIPAKRAVILTGSPGIGKTSAAIALAKDMKWDVVEMNASDQRNGDAIRNVALAGSKLNTFTDGGEFLNTKEGGRKLIILDEADNLFGNADRGAVPAILELIKKTRQPVILIVNDLYALTKKSDKIKTDTQQITFMRPRTAEIVKALGRIAESEKVSVDPEALRKMAENSNGDMRAAVRNLESLALGRKAVTNEDADALSDRIVRKDIYDLMNAIFRERDPVKARRMQMDTDETPDHIMMWIDENLPFEYKDKGDLMRGYDKLARADVFMGRVSRRQYYGFWRYAGDMMSAGVNLARRSEKQTYEKFRFPLYLMKMSRSKNVRALKGSVCVKLSAVLHTSTSRISNDVLPPLKAMMKNDPELARSLVNAAGLEDDEVAFLLDAKVDSEIVRSAMSKENAKEAETVAKKVRSQTKEAPAEEKKKEPPPASQKSLFQF